MINKNGGYFFLVGRYISNPERLVLLAVSGCYVKEEARFTGKPLASHISTTDISHPR